MLTTVILIPVNDRDAGVHFYKNVMGFTLKGYDFYTPDACGSVCINLINAGEEAQQKYDLPDVKIRFPIFRYYIDTNFLSYCKGIFERGGKFDMACSHPGGYFARIIDPFSNTFEVMCDNQYEDDNGIDPYEWPFFKRY